MTYGASGSTRDRTIVATEAIAQHTTLRAMAHLTCASQSRDELRKVVGSYAAAGIRHVLAIRGDMPGGPTVPWVRHPDGLANATELVALIRELSDFCIGVAAFPDLHPEHHDAQLDARDPGRQAPGGGELRDHPAVFQRGSLLRAGRPGPHARLGSADHCGDHAGHQAQSDPAVRRSLGRRTTGPGRRPAECRRGGRPGRTRGRHPAGHRAVPGPARGRRSGPALHHDESIARHPRDLRTARACRTDRAAGCPRVPA